MRKLKLILTFILANFVCTMVYANKHDFSQTQISNLKNAYSYGQSKSRSLPQSRMGNLDLGYIMAAILWQESSAGINCGKNGHAMGAFQNYVPTVKSRMKQDGVHKSSTQIQSELRSFNTSAHWANIELSYWLKIHNGNMSKALASYNAGWNTNAGASYSRSVMNKARYLKTNDVLKVEK